MKDEIKLETIANLMDGVENIPIVVIGDCGWIGSFPSCYIPDDYKKFPVINIEPREYKGDSHSAPVALRVFVKEN